MAAVNGIMGNVVLGVWPGLAAPPPQPRWGGETQNLFGAPSFGWLRQGAASRAFPPPAPHLPATSMCTKRELRSKELRNGGDGTPDNKDAIS